MPNPSEPTPIAPYVGRFAPSPSGPLHFGSLVCALASYLDARAHGGQWLVRIEDIDPPREQPGARQAILSTLERHGLCADAPPLLQSRRSEAYLQLLNHLEQEGLTYRCSCNRKRLRTLDGRYDGWCRNAPPPEHCAAAWRLKVRDLPSTYANVSRLVEFVDGVAGPQKEDLAAQGDFVIHRKDGYFAYQLAVVADDILQKVTHVVRGNDLLDTTARQIYLFNLLDKSPPQYAHIPVIVDQNQQKLSKQNHAPAVDDSKPMHNLLLACHCLGLEPPHELQQASPCNLLAWAAEHWRLPALPAQATVSQPD